MKAKYLISAVIAAMLVFSGCSKSSESTSTADTSSETAVSTADSETTDSDSTDSDSSETDDSEKYLVGGDYEIDEKLQTAVKDYDPSGDTRLYDLLHEIYGGDYMLKTTSSSADVSVNIKGDTMSMTSTISTTYSKAAYYTEDGKFYDIDLIDKTYSIDDSYEDPVTNADMLFGATTDFVSAEVDDNGNFAETYNVDSDIAGTEGTIRYTFNSETGSLMNFEIDLGGYSTVYSAEDFSNADDESLALPDLSDYEES